MEIYPAVSKAVLGVSKHRCRSKFRFHYFGDLFKIKGIKQTIKEYKQTNTNNMNHVTYVVFKEDVHHSKLTHLLTR